MPYYVILPPVNDIRDISITVMLERAAWRDSLRCQGYTVEWDNDIFHWCVVFETMEEAMMFKLTHL